MNTKTTFLVVEELRQEYGFTVKGDFFRIVDNILALNGEFFDGKGIPVESALLSQIDAEVIKWRQKLEHTMMKKSRLIPKGQKGKEESPDMQGLISFSQVLKLPSVSQIPGANKMLLVSVGNLQHQSWWSRKGGITSLKASRLPDLLKYLRSPNRNIK